MKVNDTVGFKEDYEQYGKVLKVFDHHGQKMLLIECWDSDAGEDYTITKHASECWKE